MTFDVVSNDLLGEVRHRTPGGSIIGTAGVAEPSHILARHQLVGLWSVTQDSDEEEEQSTGEFIIHRARVHGPVAWQEGTGQYAHVIPLEEKIKTVSEYTTGIRWNKNNLKLKG